MSGRRLDIGIGIGSRRRVPTTTSVATLGPGAGWTGTAGSGFTTPPSDPARTTAKPILTHLFVENDVFTGNTTIAFEAVDGVSISKVRVYCEGDANYVDISTKSNVTYTDANGNTKTLYDVYPVTLNWSAFNAVTASGSARIYAEAFSGDGTKQNRVIGPFVLHNRASAYSATRTVGPSGADHTTLAAAFNWVTTNSSSARNVNIKIIANGTYPLDAVAVDFNGATHWTTITADTGVTATISKTGTRGFIRAKYDGLRFRGSGIVIDQTLFDAFLMESVASGCNKCLTFDGVTISQTGGRYSVYDGMPPQNQEWVAAADNSACKLYFVDCVGSNIFNGPARATLCRNNTWTDIGGDLFFRVGGAIHGDTINGLSPAGTGGHRAHLTALNLTIPANGEIAITGASNTAGTRTLQCYISGVAQGGALSITNPAYSATGSGYTTWADVNTHINGVGGGFASTVNGAAGTRRAHSASKSGLLPTETMEFGSGRTITPGQNMTSIFDIHGDVTQFYTTVSNISVRFVRAQNVDSFNGCQTIFLDNSATTISDVAITNFAGSTDGAGIVAVSQLASVCSHLVLDKITLYDQPLHMKTDFSAGAKFNPDAYSSVKNSAFGSVIWSSTADADLVIDKINDADGSLPSGATNSTIATTNLYNGAPSNLSPVAGGNLLASGAYKGAYLPDGSWNI